MPNSRIRAPGIWLAMCGFETATTTKSRSAPPSSPTAPRTASPTTESSASAKSAACSTARACARRAASASFSEELAVMDKKLQNNVAIVTGAAKGIGLAIAERLARDGARLVLADLDEGGLKEASSHLNKEFGAEVASHAGDLSHQSTAEKTINIATDAFV